MLFRSASVAPQLDEDATTWPAVGEAGVDPYPTASVVDVKQPPDEAGRLSHGRATVPHAGEEGRGLRAQWREGGGRRWRSGGRQC